MRVVPVLRADVFAGLVFLGFVTPGADVAADRPVLFAPAVRAVTRAARAFAFGFGFARPVDRAAFSEGFALTPDIDAFGALARRVFAFAFGFALAFPPTLAPVVTRLVDAALSVFVAAFVAFGLAFLGRAVAFVAAFSRSGRVVRVVAFAARCDAERVEERRLRGLFAGMRDHLASRRPDDEVRRPSHACAANVRSA